MTSYSAPCQPPGPTQKILGAQENMTCQGPNQLPVEWGCDSF